MSKDEIIRAIQTLNPTASYEFLSQFPEEDLSEYLNNLSSVLPTDQVERTEPNPVSPAAHAS